MKPSYIKSIIKGIVFTAITFAGSFAYSKYQYDKISEEINRTTWEITKARKHIFTEDGVNQNVKMEDIDNYILTYKKEMLNLYQITEQLLNGRGFSFWLAEERSGLKNKCYEFIKREDTIFYNCELTRQTCLLTQYNSTLVFEASEQFRKMADDSVSDNLDQHDFNRYLATLNSGVSMQIRLKKTYMEKKLLDSGLLALNLQGSVISELSRHNDSLSSLLADRHKRINKIKNALERYKNFFDRTLSSEKGLGYILNASVNQFRAAYDALKNNRELLNSVNNNMDAVSGSNQGYSYHSVSGMSPRKWLLSRYEETGMYFSALDTAVSGFSIASQEVDSIIEASGSMLRLIAEYNRSRQRNTMGSVLENCSGMISKFKQTTLSIRQTLDLMENAKKSLSELEKISSSVSDYNNSTTLNSYIFHHSALLDTISVPFMHWQDIVDSADKACTCLHEAENNYKRLFESFKAGEDVYSGKIKVFTDMLNDKKYRTDFTGIFVENRFKSSKN